MSSSIVAVIGASQAQPGDRDYQDAVRLGRKLADAGYTVATGGYGGLMEAVSAGAAAGGGQVIGITAPAVFPSRSGANRYVTEERKAVTLIERIRDLLGSANAVVALPGSLGTFTELMMAWNLAHVAPFSGGRPDPIVAVGADWQELVSLLTSRLSTDGDLVTCVTTVDEAAALVMSEIGP